MSKNNNNNKSGFDRFRDRHPILINSALMALAIAALGYIALLFIDVFTSHGQQVQVPDVRNMPLEKAIEILDDAGLRWEISDSTTFYENYKPGTVIDQDPKAKSYIKKIRIIYLSVNAMHAPIIQIPKLIELPGRQGMAMLKAMGYKYVTMDSIESQFAGMILEVTVDGHKVAPGTPVSVNSKIKITVGDGSIVDLNPEIVLDQETMDSIDEANYQDAQETYEQELKAAQERKEQERKEQAEKDKKEQQNKNQSQKSDKDKKKEQDKKSSDKDKKN
ncbi:MAG: PASTA domain-containing protein [Muribaculaceae bacterium]|nr:PASTA domain-containing protein [Muribaculaceae bacterium]